MRQRAARLVECDCDHLARPIVADALIDGDGQMPVNASVVLHDLVGKRGPSVVFGDVGVPHVDHNLLNRHQFPGRDA